MCMRRYLGSLITPFQFNSVEWDQKIVVSGQ
jgi:hypothetical protein